MNDVWGRFGLGSIFELSARTEMWDMVSEWEKM